MRFGLALVLALTAGACTVGDINAPVPGEGVDAAADVTPPGPDAPGGSATCEPAATTLPDGHHNAGQACLTCHDGNAAPKFTVGGTLYTATAGTTARSGATIVVTDSANVTAKLITGSNGNFYTSQTLTPPLTVKASRCPSTDRQMPGTAGRGDCNSCHTSGGQAGPMYLQ